MSSGVCLSCREQVELTCECELKRWEQEVKTEGGGGPAQQRYFQVSRLWFSFQQWTWKQTWRKKLIWPGGTGSPCRRPEGSSVYGLSGRSLPAHGVRSRSPCDSLGGCNHVLEPPVAVTGHFLYQLVRMLSLAQHRSPGRLQTLFKVIDEVTESLIPNSVDSVGAQRRTNSLGVWGCCHAAAGNRIADPLHTAFKHRLVLPSWRFLSRRPIFHTDWAWTEV